MSTPRRLPKFDATHFESLSHEEKLTLLNDFLDALDRSQASQNRDPEQLAAAAPQRGRSST